MHAIEIVPMPSVWEFLFKVMPREDDTVHPGRGFQLWCNWHSIQ